MNKMPYFILFDLHDREVLLSLCKKNNILWLYNPDMINYPFIIPGVGHANISQRFRTCIMKHYFLTNSPLHFISCLKRYNKSNP